MRSLAEIDKMVIEQFPALHHPRALISAYKKAIPRLQLQEKRRLIYPTGVVVPVQEQNILQPRL